MVGRRLPERCADSEMVEMCNRIKKQKGIGVAAFLMIGLIASVEGLAVSMVWPPEGIGVDQSLDQVGRFALQDGIPYCETAPGDGLHEVGGQAPPCVRGSNNPQFTYMATSPYYRVFFKDTVMRMQIGRGWIELESTTRYLKQEIYSWHSVMNWSMHT